MNGDTHTLDGGIYDHLNGTEGDRIEVSLEEAGPDTFGTPMTLTLRFVTGCSDFCLVGLRPADVVRLGVFLRDEADDLIRRDAT